MENDSLLQYLPKSTFRSIMPEIKAWVEKSPYAHEYLLKDRMVYNLISIREWAFIIDSVAKAKNFHLLKALLGKLDIVNNLPSEYVAKPIVENFFKNPMNQDGIKMLHLLIQSHLFGRVPAENWIGAAAIMAYNGIDSPLGNQIVEKVLDTPELMKYVDPGMVQFLFVSIARSPVQSKKWLPFILREYNAKILTEEQWSVLIQVFTALNDQESLKLVRDSSVVASIISPEKQKFASEHHKVTSDMLNMGIPDHFVEHSGKFFTGVKMGFDQISEKLKDASNNIQKILPSRARSNKMDIENRMVPAPVKKVPVKVPRIPMMGNNRFKPAMARIRF
jgi:hypothetical protein